jgi:hypothetical protein
MNDELKKFLAMGEPRRGFLNPATLKNYILMKEGRDIMPNQVKSIHKSLAAGLRILIGIVVLKPAPGHDKYLIVDGQHRFLAVTEFFKDNPNVKIDVLFIQFPFTADKKLTAELWEYFSLGKGQKTKDVLRMNEWIPILKLLYGQDEIPVVPTQTTEHINANILIDAYWDRLHTIGCPTHPKNLEYKDHLLDMVRADFDAMMRFLRAMNYAFDKPFKGNIFYTPAAFRSLACIYFQNVDELGDAEIRKVWKGYVKPKSSGLGAGNARITREERIAYARKILGYCNTKKIKHYFRLKLPDERGQEAAPIPK